MLTGIDLPAASAVFERASRLSRRSPHLKPMAFEALMQMPLQLLIDRSASLQKICPSLYLTKPVQVRAIDEGISEFSNVVFTNTRYGGQILHQESLSRCYGMTSEELFDSLLTSFRHPVVVDPRTEHTLCLKREELRVWLQAWTTAAPACDPIEQGGCECEEALSYPQALMDRLDVLFASLRTVERAYLMRARHRDFGATDFRLALMIDCGEAAPLERIRRAMPLLGLGLLAEDVPRYLLSLNRHPRFASTVRAKLTPIHDRSVVRWKIPSSAS